MISEEIKEHAIWHVFSKQEISEFVEKAGDRNPLHQGAHPIVPGLLLLERLLGDAAFRRCGRMQLRFRHPAFAEEPLWGCWEKTCWTFSALAHTAAAMPRRGNPVEVPSAARRRGQSE